MKNLIDAYARAVGTWVQMVSGNALNRSVNALDLMKNKQYGSEEFMNDVYEYLRDVADFGAYRELGLTPMASLDIGAWAGARSSNFVHVPVSAPLSLTPVVNPQTNTVLQGLALNANNGENAVRVQWTSATAGTAPTGADKNALFQGAIFRTDNGTLIATVAVLTHLP